MHQKHSMEMRKNRAGSNGGDPVSDSELGRPRWTAN